MSDSSLHYVDGKFLRERYVSITVIVKNGAITIIDTGTKDAVTPIHNAIKSLGLNWSNVQYIIPTHVHLDHAGGASQLMQNCDNATLICHPKAARHLIDPSALIASTIAVYGQQTYDLLYGTINPIDAERVQILDDDEIVDFQGDEIQAINAPGHCYHQMALHHLPSQTVICGDSFGMNFPTLKGNFTNFVFPTTSPNQFNPEAMRATYDRILNLKPNAVQVAHYAKVPDPQYARDQMNRILDDYLPLSEIAFAEEKTAEEFTEELMQYHKAFISAHHGSFSSEKIDVELKTSIGVNAAGLLHFQNSQNQ